MHSCGGVREEILKHNYYYICCLPDKYWRIYKQGLNDTLLSGQNIYFALLNILSLKCGHTHEFLEAKNLWLTLGGDVFLKISLWWGVN